MKNNFFYALLISVLLIGCSEDDDSTSPTINGNPTTGGSGSGNSASWLIPIAEVKDGGPGKDGIPSIDSPNFVLNNSSDASFISDDDLVVGIVIGDDAKAYPHSILDWHEIVNDNVGGDHITLSYCPLTGTAFGWKSRVGRSDTTFGVSGLLYNANLILYDRETDSNWSQLGLQCVNGERIGDFPEVVQVIEMPWKEWKMLFPNTKVLTKNTGFSRDYDRYPYGSYKTDNDFFIFPVFPMNDAIPNKERVFALIDGTISKVYQFDKFGSGDAVRQQFNVKDYLVVGTSKFIAGYELEGDLKDLTFDYEFDSTDNIITLFSDNEGNRWSIYGEALSGPRKGIRLKATKSVIGYWFAIAAFYPNPLIYHQ